MAKRKTIIHMDQVKSMDSHENTRLEIIEEPIVNVHPYEGNPRKNEKAVPSVAESIRTFGFQAPILVDGDGVILAGHTRYMAARSLGLETVPVIRIGNLRPVEARAYRLADNKVGAGTAWNIGRLKEELKSIRGKFSLEMLGFGADELKVYFDDFEVDLMSDRCVPENLRKVEPGEVWKLGNHILACMDGTDGATNTELLDGRPAMACITRPWFDDRDRTERLTRQAIVQTEGACYFHLKPGFLAWAKPAWENAGGVWSTFIVNHGGAEPGPCVEHSFSAWLYGWNSQRGHYFIEERNKSDVWDFEDTEDASRYLLFAGEAIKNSTIPERTVFDPCAGDGDTLMAAEMGCRRAVCVESDPERCAYIIARWEGFTHRKAEPV